MRQPEHTTCTEDINIYKVLVGKPNEKRPVTKSKCRQKENIKMDLMEIKLSIDCIHLAHN
jgi:hypothetical protein